MLNKYWKVLSFSIIPFIFLPALSAQEFLLSFAARRGIPDPVLENMQGQPAADVPWAIVIDMAPSQSDEGDLVANFSALGRLTHEDIYNAGENVYNAKLGTNLRDSTLRYMFNTNGSINLTGAFDDDPESDVVVGGIRSTSPMDYITEMEGMPFAIVWFPDATLENGVWSLGSHLGYYTASDFTVEQSGGLGGSYAKAFNDGLEPENVGFVFVPFIPEPSTYAAILASAILAGVALRRRRMNARQASAAVAC